MSRYSGTVAERVLTLQSTIFNREEKIHKLIKEELSVLLIQGEATTAAESANKINAATMQQVKTAATAQAKPNSQNSKREIDAVIGELNNTWRGRETLRDEVHALIYEEAARLNAANDKTITEHFFEKLAELRSPSNLQMQLDNTETDLERAIRSTITVIEQAEAMDTALNETKNQIGQLNSQADTLTSLTSEREKKLKDTVETKTREATASYAPPAGGGVAANTPTKQDVLGSLVNKFKTITDDNKQNLREQICAIAYQMAEEEGSSFSAKLDELRKEKKLDKEPTELERLVNAPQNTLELVRGKLTEISNEVRVLQEKSDKTINPTQRDTLKLEAERILRLHAEVAHMLEDDTRILARLSLQSDERVKHSLAASLDTQAYEAFQEHLKALEAQRLALIQIAGKKEKDFTAIPVDQFKISEEERTGIIAKEGEFYGNISYKEKDQQTGEWKTKTLHGKDGKPITGLTRAETMDAIARAEVKLRAELNDPNYKIKVTEDRDGTIHYDTGNAHNRNVLHEEFKNAYDLKIDRKAAASAETQVQHTAANAGTTVTHTSAQQPTDSTTVVQQQPAQAIGAPVGVAGGGASAGDAPESENSQRASSQ